MMQKLENNSFLTTFRFFFLFEKTNDLRVKLDGKYR